MAMRLESLVVLSVGYLVIPGALVLADDSQRPADPLVPGLIKQWKEGNQPTRLQALNRLGRTVIVSKSTLRN